MLQYFDIGSITNSAGVAEVKTEKMVVVYPKRAEPMVVFDALRGMFKNSTVRGFIDTDGEMHIQSVKLICN